MLHFYDQGFLDLFQHAFRSYPILTAVKQQAIWLFSPVAGEKQTWILITTDDWSSSLYPGMQLSMSIFDGRPIGKGLISDSLSASCGETKVGLQPLYLYGHRECFLRTRYSKFGKYALDNSSLRFS